MLVTVRFGCCGAKGMPRFVVALMGHGAESMSLRSICQKMGDRVDEIVVYSVRHAAKVLDKQRPPMLQAIWPMLK